MTSRTATELFRFAMALVLFAGAPFAVASAQDEQGNQQASEQQDEDQAQGGDQQQQEDQQQQQENEVQLKIIELKHVDYSELRNMMRLQDANYFSGRADVRVHLSHDGDSNTLFLRAPKQRLDQIEQFVSRMDVPPGEFPKEIEFGDQAIGKTVSREVAGRATPVLEQLGYPVSVQNFGDQRVLVIRSDQQSVRDEVNQVLERFTPAEEDEQEQQQEQQQQDDPQNQENGSGDQSDQ